MNKEKKTRERCRNCIHFHPIPQATNPNKFSKNCICDLCPNMLIDIFTRRPNWCRKDDSLAKPFDFANADYAKAAEVGDEEHLVSPIDICGKDEKDGEVESDS